MRAVLPLIALLALAACDAPPPPAATAPAAAADVARAVAPASGFEGFLNAARAANGLSPATYDARLAAAAQAHADDMARQGYFSHESADGRTYIQRIRAQGHPACYPVENLASGVRSDAQAVDMWMGSPGHRANILLRGNVDYGIGRSGNIYVLVLSRRC